MCAKTFEHASPTLFFPGHRNLIYDKVFCNFLNANRPPRRVTVNLRRDYVLGFSESFHELLCAMVCGEFDVLGGSTKKFLPSVGNRYIRNIHDNLSDLIRWDRFTQGDILISLNYPMPRSFSRPSPHLLHSCPITTPHFPIVLGLA